MQDEREWEHEVNVLIEEVCTAWQLPVPPPRSGRLACSKEPQAKLQPIFPDNEVEHENDNHWQAGGERFVFIMDSQIVQRVACGHAALTNENYRCSFRRTVDKIVRFVNGGLRPPTDIDDPVQWRPRGFNTKSDWLCNQALNTKSSFTFVEDHIEEYYISNVNWEAFSDGACRGDGHSSFAWIIYATWTVSGQRHRFTVAFGYELVEGNFTSFATELWGLERAVQTLGGIIERTEILRKELAD